MVVGQQNRRQLLDQRIDVAHSRRLIRNVSQGNQTVVSNSKTFRHSNLFFEDAQRVRLQEDAFDHFVAGRNDREEFRDGQRQFVVFGRVEDKQESLHTFFARLKKEFRVGIVNRHFQQAIRDQGQQFVVAALQQMDQGRGAIATIDFICWLFVKDNEEIMQSGDDEVHRAVRWAETSKEKFLFILFFSFVLLECLN